MTQFNTPYPLTARTRNLVRFARHLPHETMDESFAADYGFRDAGSRFCLLKSPHTAPGPDECYGLMARDSRMIFRKLLGMDVEYVGLTEAQRTFASAYNAMNYYRSHIVEHFCYNGTIPMPPTEGECLMWFPAADVLRITYRLVNKSAVPVPVRLRWQAEGEPGEACQAEGLPGGFTFENTHTVTRYRYRSRAEVIADADLAFTADGCRLASAPLEAEIPPFGTLEVRFAVRVAFADEALPEWPVNLWDDATLEQAIAATEDAYAGLPVLDAEMRDHADLVYKAAGTLRTLRYRDFDRAGKPVLTMHVGKTGCAATWFWDTGISLLGLGLAGDTDAAPGAIRLLTDGIKEDGTPPVTYERQTYQYSYQLPILAWGVGHYLRQCPSPALLREAYAPLARYVRHWLDRYTGPHGLTIYPAGMTSLDDALRWHTGSPLEPRPGVPWYAAEWGRARQDLFESPDVNGFLHLEARALAAMAAALALPAEQQEWNRRADDLATAINARLLEPETQTYQDRHVETGAFTGMINLASFIPIYAGIAPPNAAEHACRDYLLSRDHFLTEMPFPVIDRAHPTFRSGGFLFAPPSHPGSLVQHAYWRGRTWIHGDYWILGALWRSGFHAEADALADQILRAISRGEGINECYDSLTGYGNGHPEFLWSSAAVLMLAYRYYREEAVAGGLRLEA